MLKTQLKTQINEIWSETNDESYSPNNKKVYNNKISKIYYATNEIYSLYSMPCKFMFTPEKKSNVRFHADFFGQEPGNDGTAIQE